MLLIFGKTTMKRITMTTSRWDILSFSGSYGRDFTSTNDSWLLFSFNDFHDLQTTFNICHRSSLILKTIFPSPLIDADHLFQFSSFSLFFIHRQDTPFFSSFRSHLRFYFVAFTRLFSRLFPSDELVWLKWRFFEGLVSATATSIWFLHCFWWFSWKDERLKTTQMSRARSCC